MVTLEVGGRLFKFMFFIYSFIFFVGNVCLSTFYYMYYFIGMQTGYLMCDSDVNYFIDMQTGSLMIPKSSDKMSDLSLVIFHRLLSDV